MSSTCHLLYVHLYQLNELKNGIKISKQKNIEATTFAVLGEEDLA
jgi:hypothetical protein